MLNFNNYMLNILMLYYITLFKSTNIQDVDLHTGG